MTFDKFVIKSKTIIGALLTFLVAIAPVLGFSFTGDDSALITELVDKLIMAATTALTIYGRFVAKEPLRVTLK